MKKKFISKALIIFTFFFYSSNLKADHWLVIGTYRQGPGGRPEVSGITSPSLHTIPMMNLDTLFQSVSLFPLALIGIFIGYQLLKIIEENLFYNIIYGLILVSSTKLIFDFI